MQYQHGRNIVELPIIKAYDDDVIDWHDHIANCYFFKNQHQIFDCFLCILNKKVYINYNCRHHLSINFMEFVVATLPKNKRDKKRRNYKSKF